MRRSSLSVWFAIIAVASALIVGSALFSQYVLDMAPCGLCLRQRLGHYVAIPLAFVASVLWTRSGGHGRVVGFVLGLAIVLALSLSLYWAGFHIGVEQKWWPGLDSCGGGGDTSGVTLEQWMNPDLGAPQYVPCDQPTVIFQWFFGGLSMASAHVLVLAPLTLLSAWVTLTAVRSK